jgi:hypothetical protein
VASAASPLATCSTTTNEEKAGTGGDVVGGECVDVGVGVLDALSKSRNAAGGRGQSPGLDPRVGLGPAKHRMTRATMRVRHTPPTRAVTDKTISRVLDRQTQSSDVDDPDDDSIVRVPRHGRRRGARVPGLGGARL